MAFGTGAPPIPGAGASGAPAPISGVGSYTPDWQGLISGDAGLKDAAAALAAGGVQNQTQRDSQIANAYESFGKNVDLTSLAQQLGMSQADIQNALGPDVQRLTQENTDAGLSTTARLDQENQDAIQKIKASLNARGMLNSGDTGYALDRQNLGYRQASSDAYQKLLGYLDQYQQGFLSAQQANAGKLADAYSSAADRQYQTNQGSPGITASPDHQDATGAWVFKGTDGNLYTSDGKPYVAPNPVATIPGNPYQAAVHPGEGNLYGTLDPGLASALINHVGGGRMRAS